MGKADEGDSGSYVKFLDVNQGCAKICGIVMRFATSLTSILLMRSRDSGIRLVRTTIRKKSYTHP